MDFSLCRQIALAVTVVSTLLPMDSAVAKALTVQTDPIAFEAPDTGWAKAPVVEVAAVATPRLPAVTINFPQPASVTILATPFDVSVSLTGGREKIVLVSSTPAVCTVSLSPSTGFDARVTVLSVGTCTLTADLKSYDRFTATPVTRSFLVTKFPNRVFVNDLSAWSVPAGARQVDGFNYGKLPITFSSATPSVCTVSGTTLTPVAAGKCTVNATTPETAHYSAASGSNSFTIFAEKMTQTVVVTGLGARIGFYGRALGADYPVNVPRFSTYASSDLKVTISSSTPSVCMPFDRNDFLGPRLSLKTVGTCSLVFTQNGNELYSPATLTFEAQIVLENINWNRRQTALNVSGGQKTAEQGVNLSYDLSTRFEVKDPTGQPFEFTGNYTFDLMPNFNLVTVTKSIKGKITRNAANVAVNTSDLPPGVYMVRIALDGDPVVVSSSPFNSYFFLTITPAAAKPQTAVQTTGTPSTQTITVPRLFEDSAFPPPFPNVHNADQGLARAPTKYLSVIMGTNAATEASSDINIVERTYDIRQGRFSGDASTVNETESGKQYAPAVKHPGSGKSVTAWTSKVGARIGIWGRFVSAKGAPAGDEFAISDADTSTGAGHVALVGTDNGFAAVWESKDGLIWRSFDGKGLASTKPIKLGIKGSLPVMVALPGAGALADRAMLAFRDDASMSPSAVLINGEKGLLSKPIKLSTRKMVDKTGLSADFLFQKRSGSPVPAGLAVIGWTEVAGKTGQDVRLALVQPSGKRLKVLKTTVANSSRDGNQSDPSIAAFPNGGFGVAWTAAAKGGSNVNAAFFSNSLKPVGTEFPVASVEKGTQWRPEITVVGSNDIVIAWVSTVNGKTSFDVRSFELETLIPK